MSVVRAPGALLDAARLERFAAELASAPHWRLSPAAEHERSYALIWADEHVNAWAIRWSADADTGFHDHDGSAAGIVVLEGAVVEERLSLEGPPIARRFRAGDTFSMPASAIHRVRHGHGAPALTVHAYSPPLLVQGVYRVGEGGALERDSVPYTEELRGELAGV
ncbi:MAG TPA: cysteine dioxygenase family protein [Solirubrobacteraceae bacterium]|jgi:quercetin dioxygenase-like cupin family protein